MGQCNSQSVNVKTTTEERLLQACAQGRYRQVATLLPYANVNCCDPIHGDTPLHKACFYATSHSGTCSLHVVELLLQHGANVNAVNNGGVTALHWACTMHDVELVRLLLQCQANIHVQDALQQTPIIRAHDCLPVVQLLLQAGAHYDTDRDCFGWTLQDRLLRYIEEEQLEASLEENKDHSRHIQQAQDVLQYLLLHVHHHHNQQSTSNSSSTCNRTVVRPPMDTNESPVERVPTTSTSPASCKTSTTGPTVVPPVATKEFKVVPIAGTGTTSPATDKRLLQRQSARIEDTLTVSHHSSLRQD
jgi:ankyrin repeat protein